MHVSLKKYLPLLFTLLLSSLFFLGLYRWDNKYTQKSTQALDGILVLSEEDLHKTPLRFLISGWRFYPDVVLTPEETQNPSIYQSYTSIGSRTNFSSHSDSSPYGCGTYQMTFFLPERLNGYALELPEIFSSYILYINETPVLEMGNPYTGQELTQNRMITFSGGEPVTITIAVRNLSHFYGGIVYPPAFGTPLSVNTSRALRFAACLFVDTLALASGLLSFYFFLKMRQANSLLFSTISFSCMVYTSYMILHSLLPLAPFPWYLLELLFGYLCIWQILALCGSICEVPRPLRLFCRILCAGFCICTLLYGLCSAHLSVHILRAFSALSTGFKLLSALYLLACTFRFIARNQTSTSLSLLYTSVIYGVAFFWDRVLPVYEPITGGWFPEWGCFFMVLAIGYFLWNSVVEHYRSSLLFAEEHRQISRQLAMQMEYSQKISSAMAENRRLIHDMKHNIRSLRQMALERNLDDMTFFLSEMEQETEISRRPVSVSFCKNTALNALIEYYDGRAKSSETKFQVALDLPDVLPLSDVEACMMIGNLLDNAVEACMRQKNDPRRIFFSSELRGSLLFLKVENTCDPVSPSPDGSFSTQKGDSLNHGIGLNSVRKIIEEHDGTIHIYSKDKMFAVGITLRLLDIDSPRSHMR